MARQNADLLVGVPPQRHYAAAGTRRATKELRFEDGIINEPDNPEVHETRYHSVFVEGFKLDQVKELGPASQQGNVPKEWKRMLQNYQNETFKSRGEWADPNNPLPDFWESPEAQDFWRILVADRNSSGNNPERFFPRLLKFAYDQQATQGKRNEKLDTSKIINYGTCEPVKDLMVRIKSMIYNRKLVRTQNNRFGLVPDATEVGDIICILYGSSVPVVMREHKKSESDAREQKKLRQERREQKLKEKVADACLRWFYRRKVNELILKLKEAQRNARRSAIPESQPASQPASPVLSHINGPLTSVSEAGNGALQASRNVSRTPRNLRKGGSILANDPSRKEHSNKRKQAHEDGRSAKVPRKETNLSDHSDEGNLFSDDGKFYCLIGECYIHNMMNGEAIQLQNDEMETGEKNMPRILFEIR
ncbi:MAG: hypothetical protein Q9157_008369 [Trypethelium eluteriae]